MAASFGYAFCRYAMRSSEVLVEGRTWSASATPVRSLVAAKKRILIVIVSLLLTILLCFFFFCVVFWCVGVVFD